MKRPVRTTLVFGLISALTVMPAAGMLAPAAGWAVDAVRLHGPGGAFWPLGLMGLVAALIFLAITIPATRYADYLMHRQRTRRR